MPRTLPNILQVLNNTVFWSGINQVFVRISSIPQFKSLEMDPNVSYCDTFYPHFLESLQFNGWFLILYNLLLNERAGHVIKLTQDFKCTKPIMRIMTIRLIRLIREHKSQFATGWSHIQVNSAWHGRWSSVRTLFRSIARPAQKFSE